MKFGIYYHEKKVPPETVKKLERLLKDATAFTSMERFPKVDRLAVLGGDGAVLRAARKAAEVGVPLLGINFGNLGFLTEFERDELEEAAELLLRPSCPVMERAMLEITLGTQKFYCLNELSIMRKTDVSHGGVVRIRAEIDSHPAGEFTADGLIVATPTGSTAYSLSAGGSILTPDCEAFLLTPVCSFSLRSRPLVCSDKSVLTFSFPERTSVVIHGDGRYLGETPDEITVRRSERCAAFLTRGKIDFFRRLTEKIY